MEELDFDNISDAVDFDVSDEEVDTSANENEVEESKDDTENLVVTPENLFDEPNDSESVGEKKDIRGIENPSATETESGDSSADFYSSIASALRNEGVLEYLDDDAIASITDADTFRDAMEMETRNRFDAKQRELYDALGYGADVKQLKQLQDTMASLDAITPEMLADDSDNQSAETRKLLIYNDYVSRGFSAEKAQREVEKSFNAGTDIEDAKDALESQKQLYKTTYDAEITRAQNEELQRRKSYEERWAKIGNDIMNTEDTIPGIKLDKRTRDRIAQNVIQPLNMTSDGNYVTNLQKYQMEHPDEFLRYVGTLFTLTDGFKSFDKLVGRIAKTEKNNSIKDLEKVLRNSTNYGANPRYVSNGRGDTSVDNSRYTLNI